MPVEFLTDDEAAAYGRYTEAPSQSDLERVFFLDDEDMDLVNQHRGEHMKAGFALQLVTVRWLGTFLDNPLDVPAPVLEFVARQLGVADPVPQPGGSGRAVRRGDGEDRPAPGQVRRLVHRRVRA